MSSKFLNIKCRPRKHDLPEDRSVFPLHSGSRRYFTRGRANKPNQVRRTDCLKLCNNCVLNLQDEYVVTISKATRFKDYENFLRKFKYKQALLCALEVSCASLWFPAYEVLVLESRAWQVSGGVQRIAGASQT